MLDGGDYLLAAAETAGVIAAVAFFSHRLRGRVLPSWHGAPARLAEAIIGIAFCVLLGQLLGTANLLREGAYLVGCALGALAAFLWLKPAPAADSIEGSPVLAREPDPPAVPALGIWVTLGVVGLLFTHWGVEAKQTLDAGIGNFDSLWYHMPFSVEMAQSGSTTGLIRTESVFLNWFYPQNSELLHTVGILLTERDLLSIFINFGWLALALLAAWVIGRPFGRGHLTVTIAAVVLECHTLVVREPGAAKNDIVAAALVLAAAALLLTWWESTRRAGPGREPAADDRNGASLNWWGLGAAGLAAGLAAGTKLTALALVASLTVAAIALAPGGRRRAAAVWWSVPMLIGGAYWYIRNLFAAANPVPQVRELGPLSLPGPDRLQEGRPDFSVAHYATDTDIWREYFRPGLAEAFGDLWFLVLLAAIAGVVLAIAQRGDRGLRALGVVAGVGMAAYLVTPLSAAGAEGAPEAFGINIRFLIPSLMLALVLLPLAPAFARARAAWALLAGTLLVLVVTNGSIDILRTHERVFGVGLALLVVLVPAGLLLARRRGASAGLVAAGSAALVAVLVVIGYPVQRDYFEDRFANPDVFGLDVAYEWANGTEDEHIGLAGTTAGFMGFGIYGPDLSNDVDYLGREAPKGGFNAIPTCEEFRRAVNDSDLDFLVTAPFLNFIDPNRPITSPETRWLRNSGGLTVIRRDGAVRVWRVDGPLRETCGPENRPLREVPDQPGI